MLVIVLSLIIIIFFLYYNQIEPEHYSSSVIVRLKNDLRKICPEVDNIEIVALEKCNALSDSYTDRKRKMYLCINAEDGKSYNSLVELLIHELAHVRTSVFDPTHSSKEYQDNYYSLLNKAIEHGIYKPNV